MDKIQSDFDQAVGILDAIVEKSEIDDRIESARNPRVAQTGDGWITHHLKLVKELLDKHKKATLINPQIAFSDELSEKYRDAKN